jgi:hypothetical protein
MRYGGAVHPPHFLVISWFLHRRLEWFEWFYGMTNIDASRHACRERKGIRGARLLITGASSKRCCGSREQAVPGAIRWNSVYPRFARGSEKGVWQKIFGILAQDADFEEAFIDSTVVRAHP